MTHLSKVVKDLLQLQGIRVVKGTNVPPQDGPSLFRTNAQTHSYNHYRQFYADTFESMGQNEVLIMVAWHGGPIVLENPEQLLGTIGAADEVQYALVVPYETWLAIKYIQPIPYTDMTEYRRKKKVA